MSSQQTTGVYRSTTKGAGDMLVARLGAALMVAAAISLVFVLAQPRAEIDGRVYGPDVTIPGALFGLGALLVSVVGPRPVHARLSRIGIGLLSFGAFAVVAMYLVEDGSNPMAALTPLVIAILAFILGGLAIAVSLVRPTG